MPFEEFADHPKVQAQYLEGLPQYDVVLPVKGSPPIPVFLGQISVDAAESIMETRRLAWNAEQEFSVLQPTEWINVGYVSESIGITAYFQYRLPGWSYNPTQWSNWPTTPPIITDVP